MSTELKPPENYYRTHNVKLFLKLFELRFD